MIVTVEVAPPLVGVTGFVENAPLALHDGSGDPVPVTLHVSVTGRLYPLIEVNVTVEVPELPAFTAAGVEAAMLKSGTFTVRLTVVECTNPPEVPVTVME